MNRSQVSYWAPRKLGQECGSWQSNNNPRRVDLPKWLKRTRVDGKRSSKRDLFRERRVVDKRDGHHLVCKPLESFS